jgi:hypothetical protein
MLAAPAAVAVKVAAARAVFSTAAVPVSWMPAVLVSASVVQVQTVAMAEPLLDSV